MPSYYTPYQQMYQQGGYFQNGNAQIQPQNSTPATAQIQNGGFVSAPSEDFARSYPVAYGTSVSFKDEREPYIYVKTMGFSQLDAPVFDKYRLVKEEPKTPQNGTENSDTYKLSLDELKAEIDDLRGQIEALRVRVNEMAEKPKTKTKKEVVEDE